MRAYLDVVERKHDCYQQLYRQGQSAPFVGGEAQVKAALESCMGWVPGSAVSEGKPETATQQEQADAREQCRMEHCTWICAQAIESVHEKFHPWFDANVRMQIGVAFWVAVFDVGMNARESGLARMQQENILGEIGSHDAEARFVREALEEAEKSGDCTNVWKTVGAKERDERIRDANDRARRYVDSLGDPP